MSLLIGFATIGPTDSGSVDGHQYELECGLDAGNRTQAPRTAATGGKRPKRQPTPSTHTGATAFGGQHTVP